MDRDEILNKALTATKARGIEYGTPESNFGRIAQLWTAYNGNEYNVKDVGIMMILLKIARSSESPYNSDHYVDIAGYAAVTAEAVDVNGNI